MPKAFDAANPPFDRLSAAELGELRAALDIGYFRPGETIIEAGHSAEVLYVVIKGAVEEHDAGDIEAVLGPKEVFDSRALVHGTAGSRFVAAEETLCYLIPKELTLDLIKRNAAFAAFFYSDISRKLDAMAKAEEADGVETVMRVRIGDANLRPGVFVEASETIERVAHTMRDRDANAVFVRAGEGRTGLVTGTDLWRSTILERKPLDTPIGQIARYNLISSSEDDFVFEALIQMTKHNIRRVAVKREGDLVGMMEDVDLLGLFAGNSQLIPGRIDRARSPDDLAAPARDIQAQVERLHRQGVKVEDIAEITSDLNRRLIAKLFDLVAPESIREFGALMIMGSEGRGEQTVRTDQDNGLLLSVPVGEDTLNQFRADFSGALQRFGFPPCPGNVMVSNPIWSCTIDTFEAQLKRWVYDPNPESSINLGIFFDAIGIAGRSDLVPRAKMRMIELMRGEAALIANFARAIDQFPGTGGVLATVMATVGREEVIDIKKSGTFPIVHGVRSLAIDKGLMAPSTVDRIRALAKLGQFGEEFERELISSFRFFMSLRVRSQLRAARLGTTEGESIVKASELSNLDRDLLRESLKMVKRFRELVRNHFKLTMF